MGFSKQLIDYSNSFTARMISGVILIQLSSIPVMVFGFFLLIEKNYQETFVNQVRSDSFWLAKIIQPVIVDTNQDRLASILEEVLLNGDIVYAQVIENNGKPVITRTFFDDQHPLQYYEDFYFGQHNDDIYFVSLPINEDGAAFSGTIRLGYDESPLQELIVTSYVRGFAIAGVYTAAMLILVIWYGRRITKPIQKIQEMAQLVASGGEPNDFHVNSKITEFRNLSGDLHRMSVALVAKTREANEREIRLRTIMDHAAEGIVVLNDRLCIESCNPAVERDFGYPANELVGHPITRLVPELEAEAGSRGLTLHQKPLSETEQSLAHEATGSRKNGTNFRLEITIGYADAGDNRLFTLIIQDITERKRLDEKNSVSEKMEAVGRLAAGIAHEINTPTQYVRDNTNFTKESVATLFQLIDGYRELTQSAAIEPLTSDQINQAKVGLQEAEFDYLKDELPSALDQSLDGLQQISEIVRAIKEFSHPGQIDRQVVDINRVVENAVKVCKSEWKYTAEMQLNLDSGLPDIECYPSMIGQSIINLVINAAHAIEEQGTDTSDPGLIKVSTRKAGDRISIEVADNGAGINASDQKKIFDPFYTTKAPGKGTGQGLSLVRTIVVDRHGGDLKVESEIAKGTRILIEIDQTPLRQEKA